MRKRDERIMRLVRVYVIATNVLVLRVCVYFSKCCRIYVYVYVMKAVDVVSVQCIYDSEYAQMY